MTYPDHLQGTETAATGVVERGERVTETEEEEKSYKQSSAYGLRLRQA
eukprot:COSAG02_NODE_46338_length_349_cov_4.964000_1_plen_47_part_10